MLIVPVVSGKLWENVSPSKKIRNWRAEEVRRRIEASDVPPLPLPSLREDSMPSSPSLAYNREYYGR